MASASYFFCEMAKAVEKQYAALDFSQQNYAVRQKTLKNIPPVLATNQNLCMFVTMFKEKHTAQMPVFLRNASGSLKPQVFSMIFTPPKKTLCKSTAYSVFVPLRATLAKSKAIIIIVRSSC